LFLSHLHGSAVFEQVTKNAVRGLWARRSKLNLVGAHINVFTGEWTQKVTFFFFEAFQSV
jgi:mannosidase alpha-like ER degradation enhancer 2